jgi:hypothetical protein
MPIGGWCAANPLKPARHRLRLHVGAQEDRRMTAVADPEGNEQGRRQHPVEATDSRGAQGPVRTGRHVMISASAAGVSAATAPRQARFTGEIVGGGRSLARTRTRLRHRTGVVTHAFGVPTKPGGQLTDPPASAGSGPVEQRCPRTRPVPWCTFVLVTGFTHSDGSRHPERMGTPPAAPSAGHLSIGGGFHVLDDQQRRLRRRVRSPGRRVRQDRSARRRRRYRRQAARLGSGRPYDGRGSCYIEFGGGLVGKVDADFLSGPSTAPFLWAVTGDGRRPGPVRLHPTPALGRRVSGRAGCGRAGFASADTPRSWSTRAAPAMSPTSRPPRCARTPDVRQEQRPHPRGPLGRRRRHRRRGHRRRGRGPGLARRRRRPRQRAGC